MQALIDKQELFPQGRLSLVLSSNPDAYALTRARNAHIDTAVLEPSNFLDRAAYTEAIVSALKEKDIDLVVFAGFMYILSPYFCSAYENRAINIHPALIPSFCGKGYYGLRVHKAALDYGVKVTGATVHIVTSGADEGPIICQKAIDILDDDTPESLQKRVMEQCEWELLPKAVSIMVSSNLTKKQ